MCGRYTLAAANPTEVRARFAIADSVPVRQRFNIAPGDEVLAVAVRGIFLAAHDDGALVAGDGEVAGDRLPDLAGERQQRAVAGLAPGMEPRSADVGIAGGRDAIVRWDGAGREPGVDGDRHHGAASASLLVGLGSDDLAPLVGPTYRADAVRKPGAVTLRTGVIGRRAHLVLGFAVGHER